MRKEAHYDTIWSDTIVQEWLDKHARAAEIWMTVSGFNTHQIALFLQKNSNLWQITKDIVWGIEKALSRWPYEDVLSRLHYYATQMYSPGRLADVRIDEIDVELHLTEFRTWLNFETRGLNGDFLVLPNGKARKSSYSGRPKEFYLN